MPEIDPIGCPVPTYLQVANVIAARIDSGEVSGKLPAERELAKEFGVAYQTLRHAMQVLRDRNLIITRQGRGTFVAASVAGACRWRALAVRGGCTLAYEVGPSRPASCFSTKDLMFRRRRGRCGSPGG